MLLGCPSDDAKETATSTVDVAPPASSSPPSPPPSASAVPQKKTPPNPERYHWLKDLGDDHPLKPLASLRDRFPVPPGYERVPLPVKTFGHFLRYLPLAAPDTPVTNFKGAVVRPANHEYVAAVAALDIGKKDLQSSAEAVVRLHAEWAWSLGLTEVEYQAVTGLKLDSKRYFAGQSVKPMGALVGWIPTSPPRKKTHENFRDYLDTVFLWTNANSLAKLAKPVPSAQVRPGDFFVNTGKNGDALVILDMAEKPDPSAPGTKRQVALLGQALNPAQRFMVLRLGRRSPWFSLRPGSSVITAFADAYQWESLRRLPRPEGYAQAKPRWRRAGPAAASASPSASAKPGAAPSASANSAASTSRTPPQASGGPG